MFRFAPLTLFAVRLLSAPQVFLLNSVSAVDSAGAPSAVPPLLPRAEPTNFLSRKSPLPRAKPPPLWQTPLPDSFVRLSDADQTHLPVFRSRAWYHFLPAPAVEPISPDDIREVLPAFCEDNCAHEHEQNGFVGACLPKFLDQHGKSRTLLWNRALDGRTYLLRKGGFHPQSRRLIWMDQLAPAQTTAVKFLRVYNFDKGPRKIVVSKDKGLAEQICNRQRDPTFGGGVVLSPEEPPVRGGPEEANKRRNRLRNQNVGARGEAIVATLPTPGRSNSKPLPTVGNEQGAAIQAPDGEDATHPLPSASGAAVQAGRGREWVRRSKLRKNPASWFPDDADKVRVMGERTCCSMQQHVLCHERVVWSDHMGV